MSTYFLTPNDTLFFRGGEPMGMGESHFQTSIFPPSPETLIGAIRTSVIAHAGDGDFEGYKSGKYNDTSWFKEIGFNELPETFQCTGPFLTKNRNMLFTPPANLFINGDKNVFAVASPHRFNEIKHSLSFPDVMWITGAKKTTSKDWKPVEGYITLEGMKKYMKGSIGTLNFEKDFVKFDSEIHNEGALFKTETRTGIALNKNNLKTVRLGHLYMTSHIRFAEMAGMIFILEGVASFPDSAVMRLGGENKTVWCEKITDVTMPSYQKDIEFLVTTMPIKTEKVIKGIPTTEFLDEDMNVLLPGGVKSRLISYAVNRPELFGGWDLATQKSKAMIQYVPAGSVFFFEKCSIKGHNNKYLIGGNDVH